MKHASKVDVGSIVHTESEWNKPSSIIGASPSLPPKSRMHFLYLRSHSFSLQSEPPVRHRKSPSSWQKTTLLTVSVWLPISNHILSLYPDLMSCMTRLSSEYPITTRFPDWLALMQVGQATLLVCIYSRFSDKKLTCDWPLLWILSS